MSILYTISANYYFQQLCDIYKNENYLTSHDILKYELRRKLTIRYTCKYINDRMKLLD